MHWSSWLPWFIVALYLFIDQCVDHGKRLKGGIKINDWHLANDPQFVEDVAEAVKRSYERDVMRQRQTAQDFPDWPDAQG